MTSSEPTSWDRRFLELAAQVGSWSKDPSTKVGAVIAAADNALVSVGFNGFPRGMPDREEWLSSREEKYSRIVHGEVNALIFAGKVPPGCTLYTHPFLPCDRCVVQMLQAGILRYVAPMPSDDAVSRWGAALERTRNYIVDIGGHYLELGQ